VRREPQLRRSLLPAVTQWILPPGRSGPLLPSGGSRYHFDRLRLRLICFPVAALQLAGGSNPFRSCQGPLQFPKASPRVPSVLFRFRSGPPGSVSASPRIRRSPTGLAAGPPAVLRLIARTLLPLGQPLR